MLNQNELFKQNGISPKQVDETIKLLESDHTVPFIARYRKEATGGLDEVQIRLIQEVVEKENALNARKKTVLVAIEEQGKLTDALKQKIEAATTLAEVNDLYLPYKQKRKTRAMVAKAKGLEKLANFILIQDRATDNLDTYVAPFLNDEVPTMEEAMQGAMDIVAEMINETTEIRKQVREKAIQFATLDVSKKDSADDPKSVYETYYDFSKKVRYIQPYQALAINRGEKEKILTVSMSLEERDYMGVIDYYYRPHPRSVFASAMRDAIDDCVNRLLLPAIERDVRRHLTELSEEHAIDVFADNLESLLLQPPIINLSILGIDPAYRTGCKTVVVDPSGKLLEYTAIYPHQPQNKWNEAKATLHDLIEKYDCELIVIGNGTASRETEKLAIEVIQEASTKEKPIYYLITNEAGASVYSASDLAREEFPDLDVSIRGAISIARRVQDPLAELVKIDPKAIGVGMYQHDVDQKMLSNQLDQVIESVVNRVGVELNTASPTLLKYISGISNALAKRIVAYREKNGVFNSRKELTEVSGLGAKAFEQAAGFLRIRDSENPLDNTGIHPESYDATLQLMNLAGIKTSDSLDEVKDKIKTLLKHMKKPELAQELGIGEYTLNDILSNLRNPGRDPREEIEKPILRQDVLKMEDLKEGMILSGTVRNVVDFGSFVDIGVKQDGLLHKSEYGKDDKYRVGDVIKVRIKMIDINRGRIGLAK